MSWIVSLFKFKKDFQHFADIQGEEDALPLGTKSEILALLKKWFPDANYHDPSWISAGPGAELSEIIVGGVNELDDNGPIYGLGFRNPSYRLLRDVCTKMSWKAVDPSTGDFIDFASVPPDYYSDLFIRRRPQSGTQTLADFIVYLRNQVLKTRTGNNKSDLQDLASTLQTLGDFFIESGDSTFWTVVDKLTYLARNAEFADYAFHVPDEAAIRDLEPKQG